MSNEITSYLVLRNTGDDVLTHHGIKGQRWGVRNGDSYPLSYDEHSAAEKRKNSKGKLDNYDGQDSGGIKGFAKRHKKALIIGGTILATVAVAKGVSYAKNRREDRISEILKTTEKSFKKNLKTIRKEEDPESVESFIKLHEHTMKMKFNKLFEMNYSDLAKEAKRVKLMNKMFHSDEDCEEEES